MKKNSYKLLLFLVLILVVVFHNKDEYTIRPDTQDQGSRQVVVLDRVVDGDTLVVRINNQKERVRLIGIDTPESTTEHRTIECFGFESADFLRELLKHEENIILEYDPVVGTQDRHGRLLAYVFLNSGEDVNNLLIHNGYAYEYTYQGQDYRYKQNYKKAQQEAEKNKRGLWSPAACGADKK